MTITGDAGCRKTLSAIFEKHAIDIVIHFAGFKSVSESKSEPLKYYQNNVGDHYFITGNGRVQN